ncbi:MAG: hypothetical protein J6D30_03290 [Clostridia bacterium]|nr:hypothetical protein [Clostridia bacterium]
MDYLNPDPNQQNVEATQSNDLPLNSGKGGIIGKVVACILSFIIGIVATIGGVIGAGYFVTTQPTSTIVDTVNSILGTDFKYTDFLDESYGDQQVLNLLTDVLNAAMELTTESASLKKLSNISPKIKEAATLVKDAVGEFGIQINEDELIDTPFSEMTDFLKDRLNETPAGDILSSFGMESPLLMSLCYGEEGIDYEIDADGNVTMLGDSKKTLISDLLGDDVAMLLDKVPLASVLTDLNPDDPEDDMMFSIAYGAKDVTYKIIEDDSEQGYHVEMLQVYYYKTDDGITDYDHEEVETLSITPLVGVEGYTVVLDLGKDENDEPVTETQYIVYNEETHTYYAFENFDPETKTASNPILYKKTTVGQLTQDVNPLLDHLYLKDILHIDANSNKIMLNLGYGTQGIDFVIREGQILMINDATPHTLGYLKNHKDDLIDSIHLSDVLTPDYDSGIIMYMLYGTKDLHYTMLNEGTAIQSVQMLPAFVYIKDGKVYDEHGYERAADTYTINLDTLQYTFHEHTYDLQKGAPQTQDKQEDGYVKHFLYLHGEQVEFETTRLCDLKGEHNPLNEFQSHLTLEDVLGKDALEGNEILECLADYTIDQLPNRMEELTVGEIFETNDNAIMDALATTPILDIPTKIKTLTVVEVFPEAAEKGDNSLLYALRNTSLLEIPNEIKTLKVEDVFDNLDSNPILKNLKTCPLLDIPDQVTELTVEQVFGSDITKDENQIPTGTWKYLLYNKSNDSDGDKSDVADYDLHIPVLTSMTSLMNNMQSNIHSATLQELSDDGIISGLSPATLSQAVKVKISIKVTPAHSINASIPNIDNIKEKVSEKNGTEDNIVEEGSGKEALTLGELTVDEMLSYLNSIFTLFDQLASGTI